MQYSKGIQAEVVRKIQECLKELGFEPETRLSEHEGIVHARKDIEGACIRVVMHVTDREPKSAAAGSVSLDIAKTRLTQAVIRPSLSAQTATRFVPEQETPKEKCE
jgi:hypothetical protein